MPHEIESRLLRFFGNAIERSPYHAVWSYFKWLYLHACTRMPFNRFISHRIECVSTKEHLISIFISKAKMCWQHAHQCIAKSSASHDLQFYNWNGNGNRKIKSYRASSRLGEEGFTRFQHVCWNSHFMRRLGSI